MDRTYVGQTNNLARRFHEHNSGPGSAGTADATYRPYCMAAYICGLSHMIENELDYLERRWKLYIHNLPSGNQNVWARIQQGCRIVEEYNANADEINFIRFVITIEQRTL